jgi:hypothetical protein
LTVKASLIFGKRFTIFKTVNRFPKLSYLSLYACFISDRQNLAIVGRRDPVGAGVRQHLVAGILPAPESGHRNSTGAGIRPPADQISARILLDPAGSGQNGRNPATATGRCQIPATFTKLLFLHFVIFSGEPNTEKYFRENHFF